MIFATYQCHDYMTYKNPRYKKLKELLGIPVDKNIYWCVPANNVYQMVINTYSVAINIPEMFVLFETDDYYKIDACKWNRYVEKMDASLINEDLLDIDHEDAVEYIVTEIPEKRFEVNTTPGELAEIIKDVNNKYFDCLRMYAPALIHGFQCYPDRNRLMDMPLAMDDDTDEQVIYLQKLFVVFRVYLMIPLYFSGLKYIGHEPMEKLLVRTPDINEALMIVAKLAEVHTADDDLDRMYDRYRKFHEFVYNRIFQTEKIYPNDPCPCGSGLKYKKCCMRENRILPRLLSEGLS